MFKSNMIEYTILCSILHLCEVLRSSKYLDKIDFPKFEFFVVLVMRILIVWVFTLSSKVIHFRLFE